MDPITGNKIKDIYVKNISKKTGKEIWSKRWNYYRHRNKLSIEDFYKQNSGKDIQITFFGISEQKYMTIPSVF